MFHPRVVEKLYKKASSSVHTLYDERLGHWNQLPMAPLAEHGQAEIEGVWFHQKAAWCQ
jgi:hypothetical protein